MNMEHIDIYTDPTGSFPGQYKFIPKDNPRMVGVLVPIQYDPETMTLTRPKTAITHHIPQYVYDRLTKETVPVQVTEYL